MALAGQPEVARGVLVAILGDDPDIRRVREEVGRAVARRLTAALAPIDDPELVETLLLAYSGAMIVVGTTDHDFAAVLHRMEVVARQIQPTGASLHGDPVPSDRARPDGVRERVHQPAT